MENENKTDIKTSIVAETRQEEEEKKLHILIVEDNQIAIKVLTAELREINANITTISDGAEAAEIAEKEIPDVITIEIDLPGMNGINVCRRLKNNYNTRKIPVIFVTQVDSAEERKKAFAAGAVDYMVTPLPNGKLASKIQRLLDLEVGTETKTILVVEDSTTIRNVVKKILLKEKHIVVEAADGMQAWETLQKRDDIEIILTDINMPNMDGFQLCRLIRGNPKWEYVPIIVFSTMSDKDDIASLLNAGADDYIIKPFAREEFLARLKSHIRVRHLYNDLSIANEKLKQFTESLEKIVEFRTEELNEANMESIMMLAVASESRDTDTGNHVRRIQYYSRKIALFMGYSETKADEIAYSSILHDVGKIAIPDSILKKPGKLTDQEFKDMQEHTVHGEAIISEAHFFKTAREVARWHHEKFNGKGYPDGFEEYSIPVAARIVAVADVFDALTQKRVYKDAWPDEKAHKLIMDSAGEDFDPMVVDAFDKIYKSGELTKIREEYK